jgi:hypothetical protein
MTRRGFYRLGIVLPIVGFLAAAALRGYFGFERPPSAATGAHTEWVYPASSTRGLVAYLGVAAWAWRLVAGSSGEVARRFWQAPLLFVGLNWLLVGVFAVTQERGVVALPEQRTLLALRTVVHLVLGYAYVAVIQWGARHVGEFSDQATHPRSVNVSPDG